MDQQEQWNRILQGSEEYRGLTVDAPVKAFADRLLAEGCRRVLDLGCGCGRNVLAFAERNMEVMGVDWSSEAISLTEVAVKECGLRHLVTLQRTDWRELRETYQGILAWHVLGHGSEVDVLASLEQLLGFLSPGGLCLVNVPGLSDRRTGPVPVGATCAEFMIREGPERGIPHVAFSRDHFEATVRRLGGRCEYVREQVSDRSGRCHLEAIIHAA